MGEQGGLRTGWIAAFGTEGYEGEPPLLEELGVNFGHIKGKVREERKKRAAACAIGKSNSREETDLSSQSILLNSEAESKISEGTNG